MRPPSRRVVQGAREGPAVARGCGPVPLTAPRRALPRRAGALQSAMPHGSLAVLAVGQLGEGGLKFCGRLAASVRRHALCRLQKLRGNGKLPIRTREQTVGASSASSAISAPPPPPPLRTLMGAGWALALCISPQRRGPSDTRTTWSPRGFVTWPVFAPSSRCPGSSQGQTSWLPPWAPGPVDLLPFPSVRHNGAEVYVYAVLIYDLFRSLRSVKIPSNLLLTRRQHRPLWGGGGFAVCSICLWKQLSKLSPHRNYRIGWSLWSAEVQQDCLQGVRRELLGHIMATALHVSPLRLPRLGISIFHPL